MSWIIRPTIRVLTKEQFSDGTTIDGSRLDHAMEDTVSFWNKLPLGAIRTRWTMQQYVFGWQPQADDNLGPGTLDHHMPWLRIRNTLTQYIDGPPPTTIDEVTNEYRLKGSRVVNIDDAGSPLTADGSRQYAWTLAFRRSRPRILHDVFLLLLVDSSLPFTYTNFWTAGNPAPEDTGVGAGEHLKDLVVQIAVASPFGQENRALDSLEWNMAEFDFEPFMTPARNVAISHVYDDMLPPHHDDQDGHNKPYGLVLRRENLNIPIPQGAIVRASVVIPFYPGEDACGWNSNRGNVSPYFCFGNQAINLALTFLEELEDGGSALVDDTGRPPSAEEPPPPEEREGEDPEEPNQVPG
jgi:hypothetical protein